MIFAYIQWDVWVLSPYEATSLSAHGLSVTFELDVGPTCPQMRSLRKKKVSPECLGVNREDGSVWFGFTLQDGPHRREGQGVKEISPFPSSHRLTPDPWTGGYSGEPEWDGLGCTLLNGWSWSGSLYSLCMNVSTSLTAWDCSAHRGCGVRPDSTWSHLFPHLEWLSATGKRMLCSYETVCVSVG